MEASPPDTRREHLVLLAIVVVAAALRLAMLGSGPVLGDEPTYAVRSLGLLDTLGSHLQTTPVDWYPELPGWSSLSFHDHPPLVFWVQHIFYKEVGQSILWCRLPSALAGVVCTWLIFLTGRALFGAGAGLLAAALFATNGLGVFFGRVAVLESVTLAVMLAGLVMFLRWWDRPGRWAYLGGILGLGLLSKYIAAALLPVYLVFWGRRRRGAFRDGRLYLAVLVGVFVCLPVIIYNVQMIRTAGHGDVQVATLLGHDVSEHWPQLAGKEQRGTLGDRIAGFGKLVELHSPLFLGFAILGSIFVVAASKRWRRSDDDGTGAWLVGGALIALLLFLLVAGTSDRFLFYLTPFLCLAAGALARRAGDKLPAVVGPALAVAWVAYEAFFSLGSIAPFTAAPRGPACIAHAPRLHVVDHGVHRLDRAIEAIVGDARPLFRARVASPALDAIIGTNSELGRGPKRGLMFVVDRRAAYRTTLWVCTKRLVYEGWPFLSADALPDILATNPDAEFELCFVHTTEQTLRNSLAPEDAAASRLRDELEAAGVAPQPVARGDGEPAFHIYRFDAATARRILDPKD